MRILADENCPRLLVHRLREVGHDVAWIREIARGAPDAAVLARAQRQKRTIVTFDHDFGEMAFRRRLPAECGVILVRVRRGSTQEIALRTIDAMATRTSWAGQFATITDAQLRIRPLPER